MFSWLGVHMYLSDEAVKNTLAVMGKFMRLVVCTGHGFYHASGGLCRNARSTDPVNNLAIIVGNMSEPF